MAYFRCRMKCYLVCHKDQFWDQFLIIFTNVLRIVVKNTNCFLFADDVKIYRKIKSPDDSWLLLSDTNNVRAWFTSNYMELNVNKTRVFYFCIKTDWHDSDYKLYESSVTNSDCIKDLGVFVDTKIHFHQEVDNIFSQAIRILGLIRNATFSFSSLHSLLVLYCILVRPK